jgi:hypothetical protein
MRDEINLQEKAARSGATCPYDLIYLRSIIFFELKYFPEIS